MSHSPDDQHIINNKKIVLVMGKPTTGKTTSLMNIQIKTVQSI